MKSIALTAVIIFNVLFPFQAFGQTDVSRLSNLERRFTQLERHPRGEDAAEAAAFISAAICALWAQQTRRNAWLWFFLGLFFNVITLVVLLYKNAHDKPIRAVPSG